MAYNRSYYLTWRSKLCQDEERHAKYRANCKTRDRASYLQRRAVILAKQKCYRAANPKRVAEAERRKQLKRKYGLTIDGYERLLSAQGGLCAICRRPRGKYRLSVDHCHKSGEIRGLLCARCNRALALFWEDPTILRRCADYLEVTKL
jgi:hypothetical protein